MATTAKNAEYLKQLKKLEQAKEGKATLRPRDRIRIRHRCRMCGRSRAIYRKFGICRICFRDMASYGMIPGVKKASW